MSDIISDIIKRFSDDKGEPDWSYVAALNRLYIKDAGGMTRIFDINQGGQELFADPKPWPLWAEPDPED